MKLVKVRGSVEVSALALAAGTAVLVWGLGGGTGHAREAGKVDKALDRQVSVSWKKNTFSAVTPTTV